VQRGLGERRALGDPGEDPLDATRRTASNTELLPEGRRRRDLAITVERILNRDLDTKILPFDHAASQQYAPILASRQSAGKPIIRADAQVASICAKHGATLATRNVKDFADTGIDLIDPWES
jgi:predicted nucleic acid-binding protein